MPTLNGVNPNYYNYDCYSGANVGIYIGDLLVYTAIGIEFSLVQNKRPFYGYASQLWDGVARGTVQCSGNLIINFEKSQFLSTVISESLGHRNTAEFFDREFNENHFGLRTSSKDTQESLLGWGVDESFEQKTSGQPGWADPQSRNRLINKYWHGVDHEINESHAYLKRIASREFSKRPDDHSFPFDIIITYGDVFGNDLRESSATKNINPSLGNSTVHRLYQVELTGFGQSIQADGQPILEQYPFICREVL